MLWQWVNDPDVRKASFSSEKISWETHKAWFNDKLEDSNSYIFIALNEKKQPIGQVRFDIKTKNNAEIDISVDPEKRGEGYGLLIIEQAVNEFFKKTQVEICTAWIKTENHSSQKLFNKAGFVKVDEKDDKTSSAYRYDKKRY
jgi:RimJ/RimL family protein N-acetyltransferase